MAGEANKVDRYISAAPPSVRGKLRQVRAAVKRAAPEAREGFSYKMPQYAYKGRLAWFGLFKGHIGLFLRPPVLEEHRRELRGYVMTMSSLHIPIEEPVPTALVEKLVRAAKRKNDEREGTG